MARVVLVTGGSRSGKSEYARRLAEELPGPRCFVATCLSIDDEMEERIRKHRQARLKADWRTIEEPLELARTLVNSPGFHVYLVDCLTLWINNLVYQTQEHGLAISEEDVNRKCREVLDACRTIEGTVVFVTNEVGSGIVPENKTTRLYRDLVGRCNQIVAGGADEVFLVTCGIPITLKKGNP